MARPAARATLETVPKAAVTVAVSAARAKPGMARRDAETAKASAASFFMILLKLLVPPRFQSVAPAGPGVPGQPVGSRD
jgi:hypothetical protein